MLAIMAGFGGPGAFGAAQNTATGTQAAAAATHPHWTSAQVAGAFQRHELRYLVQAPPAGAGGLDMMTFRIAGPAKDGACTVTSLPTATDAELHRRLLHRGFPDRKFHIPRVILTHDNVLMSCSGDVETALQPYERALRALK
jgi:hypothetical protein